MNRICFFFVIITAFAGHATAWRAPNLDKIRWPEAHPYVACTPEEAARLRDAYAAGEGNAYYTVRDIVRRADRALRRPLVFPPRGGQHNTHYQCPEHQVPLRPASPPLQWRPGQPLVHTCPVDEKTFRGAVFDEVIYGRIHRLNLRKMRRAAWAYTITGKMKYAEYARKVLLGYAQRYRRYPFHGMSRFNFIYNWVSGGHLFEQTLDEASALTRMIGPAYDLVYDSGALGREEHRAVREGLLRPMVKTITKYKAGINNWQTWHNAALVTAAALLRDRELMKRALYDGIDLHGETDLGSELVKWTRVRPPRPGNGVLFQLKYSLSREGMWYENSWGYHFYALRALVAAAEVTRRLGIDLWGHPRLRQALNLPLSYRMPDGALPRFGDAVQPSLGRARSLYETAYAVTGEPRYAVPLEKRAGFNRILRGAGSIPFPARTADRGKSALYRDAGHVILRGDGPGRHTVAATFGRHGGFHGHLDKLSFVHYAHGRELGVDPGRAASQAYHLPVHTHWYKATLSHNTVVIDRQSQRPSPAAVDFFRADDRYAAVSMRSEKAYPGVTHERVLLVGAGYTLVVDRISSDRTVTADWYYHFRGQSVESETADQVFQFRCYPGSEYIKKARSGKTDGMIRLGLRAKGMRQRLFMAAAPGSRVVTGMGPGRSVRDRWPLVMVRRRGREVRFVTVLEASPRGGMPAVLNVFYTIRGDVWHITVNRVKGRHTVRVRPSRWLELEVEGRKVFEAK